MRILMLAPQPFFEPRGTPFSVLGRLQALSGLGHEIDLVTYHVGRDVTIPKVTIHRTIRMPFVTRVPIGPSAVKLFLDVFLLAKTVRLLARNHYDLIHAHEEASFFSVFLSKLFRVPHLYDMHSSLPQQLSNFEYTSFRPVVRLFEWLENYVIRSSGAVITICPALRERVAQISKDTPQVLIENVANCEDPDAVPEAVVRSFKERHELDGRAIVLYAGTFEPYQGLDLLIASAQRVVRRRQDVLFVLMGGNHEQVEQYRRKVEAAGLAGYVRFTGARPPEEVPIAIKAADVLVSPRLQGTNTPLKIYAYLKSGKPIVATSLYTHAQVLNDDVAVLVEPDAEAFGEGILSVLGDAHLAEGLGEQARRYFDSCFSMQSYVERTRQVLELAVR